MGILKASTHIGRLNERFSKSKVSPNAPGDAPNDDVPLSFALGLQKVMKEFEMPSYLEPTRESGKAFLMRGIAGKMVMLNLLRFRIVADYAASPALAPKQPISGEAAYKLYMSHTMPYLEKSGGRLLFYGRGGPFLIGPSAERWDAVRLV